MAEDGAARARNDSCGEHQSGFRAAEAGSERIGWSEAEFLETHMSEPFLGRFPVGCVFFPEGTKCPDPSGAPRGP